MLKNYLDQLIGAIDLFSLLCTSEHYFSTRENQQHDLGVCHLKNESGEELGVVSAKLRSGGK